MGDKSPKNTRKQDKAKVSAKDKKKVVPKPPTFLNKGKES